MKKTMVLELVDLPWNKILTASGQFSEGRHENRDEAGGETRGAGWLSHLRDLKQHRLQTLKKRGDQFHRAARVVWHREKLTNDPHLRVHIKYSHLKNKYRMMTLTITVLYFSSSPHVCRSLLYCKYWLGCLQTPGSPWTDPQSVVGGVCTEPAGVCWTPYNHKKFMHNHWHV